MGFQLKPKETKTFYAVSGSARNTKTLNRCVEKITKFDTLKESQEKTQN